MVRGLRVLLVPVGLVVLLFASPTSAHAGVRGAPFLLTAEPETTIVSHPASPTRSTSARFAFTSSVYGSSFRCWIDHGAGQPCTSPRIYDGLAEGWHGFAVAAISPAGVRDPTPARFFWLVDLTPPETTIVSHPALLTRSTSARFAFTSSVYGSSFRCWVDHGAGQPCTSPRLFDGLAAGWHGFAVAAIDPAGNVDPTPARFFWLVDLTPPETTLVGHPAAATRSSDARFGFSANEAGSTFACRLDLGLWQPCTTPQSYSGLAEGGHRFDVRATDPAGNTDPTPARFDWQVDLTPPETTITTHPLDPSGSTDASFGFTSSERGSSFQCRLDSGAWQACTSPQAYSSLAEGTHSFRARAFDAAGNWDTTPARYGWEIRLHTVTWTGAARSSDWATAANWTPARLPTDGDEALIPAGAPHTPVVVTTDAGAIDNLDAPGGLVLDGGTLTLTGPHASAAAMLAITGGTLSLRYGMRSLTVTGRLEFTGGSVSGDGEYAPMIIAPGATALLGNDSGWPNAFFGNPVAGHLINRGDATLAGTLNLGWGSTFTNEGTLTVSGNALIDWSGKFVNAGSVEVIAGNLTLGTGHYDYDPTADSGSYTAAAGASLAFGGQRTLGQGASISGDGTVHIAAPTALLAGSQVNVGAVSAESNLGVAAGSSFRTGSYSNTVELVAAIKGATPAIGYTQLQVTGNADLAGRLRIVTVPGFTPTPGQTFPIITYASHTGTYSTVEGTDLGGGLSYQLDYGPAALTLTAVQH